MVAVFALIILAAVIASIQESVHAENVRTICVFCCKVPGKTHKNWKSLNTMDGSEYYRIRGSWEKEYFCRGKYSAHVLRTELNHTEEEKRQLELVRLCGVQHKAKYVLAQPHTWQYWSGYKSTDGTIFGMLLDIGKGEPLINNDGLYFFRANEKVAFEEKICDRDRHLVVTDHIRATWAPARIR